MKPGMWVVVLGVLAVIVGGAMYASDWHRTIGLGGVGVGIILLVAGGVMSMKKEKATPPPVAQPTQG